MFESLMFWKKKEDPSASSAASFASFGSGLQSSGTMPPGFGADQSQSFHPLDVQNPPAFGDMQNGGNMSSMGGMSGMSGGMGMNGMSPAGFGQSVSSGVPTFPTGMANSGGLPTTSDPFGSQSSTSFSQPQFGGGQSMQQFSAGQLPALDTGADPNKIHPRDIELILSRLELVRSELENVNHRLSFIEQSFGSRQGQSGLKNSKNNWY